MMPDYLPVILGAVVVIVLIAMLVRDSKRSDIDIPAPAKLRDDLLFGYYGCVGDQVAETRAHVNLHWECFWSGLAQGIADIRAAAMVTVIDVTGALFERRDGVLMWRDAAEHDLRAMFQALRDAGVLQHVRAVVPIDEPNLREHRVCGDMPRAAALIRRVAAEFQHPVLVGMVLTTHGEPMTACAIEHFDILGFDDYPERSAIFRKGGAYEQFRRRLRPDQRTWIIPGGYSDCRQDPEPFVNFAHAHPEVWAIVAFLWRDPHGNGFEGIADDPEMRAAYTAAGRSIMAPARGSP